jgi:ketosteroid isomerase-like protein
LEAVIMKPSSQFAGLLLCAMMGSAPPLSAQNRPDLDAIHKIIDQYSQTEDAGDMIAQAKLMAPDRVWIGPAPAGRQTDQAMNMRAQQAQYDVQKKVTPSLQWFTQARDRLVKFYGNGAVAVASFYWYREPVIPPGTAPEVAQQIRAAATPAAITLVLEKQGGEWKIVHTHVSNLIVPRGP